MVNSWPLSLMHLLFFGGLRRLAQLPRIAIVGTYRHGGPLRTRRLGDGAASSRPCRRAPRPGNSADGPVIRCPEGQIGAAPNPGFGHGSTDPAGWLAIAGLAAEPRLPLNPMPATGLCTRERSKTRRRNVEIRGRSFMAIANTTRMSQRGKRSLRWLLRATIIPAPGPHPPARSGDSPQSATSPVRERCVRSRIPAAALPPDGHQHRHPSERQVPAAGAAPQDLEGGSRAKIVTVPRVRFSRYLRGRSRRFEMRHTPSGCARRERRSATRALFFLL